MRALGHQPRLNGIRGLAILSVVVYHYAKGGWIPGGFLGVDLFFVLSGFLITALLTNEWDSTGTISMRTFYSRRALRLLPALATVLAPGA